MTFVIRSLFFYSLIVIGLSDSANVQLNKIVKILEKDKNVKSFMKNFENNFKDIATLGLVMGTSKTAKRMEINILELLRNFIQSLQGSAMPRAIHNYQKIEDTIERDKKAIEILNNAMSLALDMKSLREYRQALNKISNEVENATNKQNTRFIPKDKKQLMQHAQSHVDSHIELLRKNVASTLQRTVESMQKTKKKEKSEISSTPPATTTTTTTSQTNVMSLNDIFKHETLNLPQLYISMPLWSLPTTIIPNYHHVESFYHRFRRQNDENGENSIDGDEKNEEKEEEFGNEEEGDALSGGGGLVGLIGSLSGGEGGSDVGALVGALSGVITNLFGVISINFQ